MVTADGKATALFHCAIGVQDVIGRPAAHIDDQRAKILLMLSEHHLRRSEPAKNNVLHVQRKLFHAANGILNACAHAVDDMKIGF